METKTLTAIITFKGNTTKMEYHLTNHFSKRSRQRAISEEQIEYALNCGEEIEKQGYLFYVVGGKVNGKGCKLSRRTRKLFGKTSPFPCKTFRKLPQTISGLLQRMQNLGNHRPGIRIQHHQFRQKPKIQVFEEDCCVSLSFI